MRFSNSMPYRIGEPLQFGPAATTMTLLLLTCIGGCDNGVPLGSVTGTVTYNGDPLDCATIEFVPLQKGKQSVGHTDDNGEYVLQYTLHREGALLGLHHVLVKAYPEPGSPPVHIPAKYGGKSEVEFEVKPGANTFDVTINANE